MLYWQRDVDTIKRPDRFKVLDTELQSIKPRYDYVIIDVPPTFNAFSLNAIFAADNIVLVLQTEESSYTSSIDTVKMLGRLKSKYGIKFHFLGALLYLMIKASTTRKVKSKATQMFKGFLLNNVIRYHERINRFTESGIRDKDFWDTRALYMYHKLINEITKRIEVENG